MILELVLVVSAPIAKYTSPLRSAMQEFQDLFFNVILKAWVPTDGTGGSTSRQVYAQTGLALNKGD
jgi:hypothetical protein